MSQLPGYSLAFHQPLSVVTRLIAGFGGALTLLAPYELLIRPGVPVFTLGMIPFWVISLGALSVGCPLMLAATLGLSKTVRFDVQRGEMDVHADGSFGIHWRRTYAFASIGAVSVREDEDSDGPPYYRLEVAIAGRKRPFEIDIFEREVTAQSAAAAVEAVLAGKADPS